MAVPGEMEKGDASSTTKTIRIYIGGLGESVTAEDLKKTFATPQLGKVESMDIVRTKGRSFAYLDLIPSSEKSLPKLFSTYNGCMWKGGRLRIEKAKEHFLLRMKREWEEDVALATATAHPPIIEAEMTSSLKNQKKGSKLDDTQIRIYFPKLGKIKPVPLRGTGKHKYSFQRVEVPSIPIHFCDCEEHSGHPDTSKQKSRCDDEYKDGGMDEKELNIMNSVLNKIFERANHSEKAPEDSKLAKEVRSSTSAVNHLQNDKILINQEMEDDDNLILNMVSSANDRTTVLEDPAQETMRDMDDDDDNLIINIVAGGNDKTRDPAQEAIAALQSLLSKDSQPATDKQRQGRKMCSNRKRKAPSENEDGEARPLPSTSEAKWSSNALICDKTDVSPKEVKSGSQPSNRSAKFPKKSPWKDLISASSGATFSVSAILPSATPCKEMHPSSKGVSVSSSSDKKDEKVSFQHEELDKVEEMHPNSKGVSVCGSSDKKDEKVSVQHEELDKVEEMHPGSEGVSVSLASDTKDEKVSDQHAELDKVVEDSTGNVNGPVDIYARGAAWRKKTSWTQLVRDATSNSFSISQILPGLSLPKPELPMMGEIGEVEKSSRTDINDSQAVSTSGEGTNVDAPSARGSCSGDARVKEQKNIHFSKELPDLGNFQHKGKINNEAFTPTLQKKLPSAPKQSVVGDTNFSETCSFMRSAASMKEWTKTKAALSGSLKNKTN